MQIFKFADFTKKYLGDNNAELDLLTTLLFHLPSLKDVGWLAGGALRRLITKQKLDSDFDFFFKSPDSFEGFYKGIKSCKNIKVQKEFRNEHNITLIVNVVGSEDGELEIIEGLKLQLINIQYYNTIEEVLESFDYTLCQVALDDGNLVLGDTTLWDLGNKRIVINKITYPVASLRRLLKYTNQGYYACQGCLTGLLSSVAEKPELLENKIQYID